MVVSKDARCHTYCVKNTRTGQEKVVHLNLMLQANFLPHKAEDDECYDDSLSSQEHLGEFWQNSAPTDCQESGCTVKWVAFLPTSDEYVGQLIQETWKVQWILEGLKG